MCRIEAFCRIIALLWAAAILTTGCASETTSPTSGAKVADVGKVVVTIGSSVNGDNRKLLDEISAPERLQVAIQTSLTKAGKFNSASPRVLEAQVTDLRLRSRVTTFMTSQWSGIDALTVEVTVRQGEQVVRQFPSGYLPTGTLSPNASWRFRFETMALATAERIAQTL